MLATNSSNKERKAYWRGHNEATRNTDKIQLRQWAIEQARLCLPGVERPTSEITEAAAKFYEFIISDLSQDQPALPG